ncbi:MAG TPA: Fur family transcriptional regulator [Desulfovibrio sp.]|jgi:Fur family ferric uptake transcriptional regulator|uniref:Fur family transcriptional regulator n=1 Tax=Desulfovibrio TaxID=872 RepID=UPI000407D252|nr:MULTISPECIES: Fur family transcriptional regulator [Desulfovibrio]MDY0306645.1 Fur family transcriptional regulator [Desulfovibrionaceae bacterium]HMM37903.1 Fur family transcriptional regulator [Desulfovibrio sp.]
MKSAEEAFTRYLAENGLKMTPQRRTILDAFLNAPGHISSEELYASVKRSDESIGQATVYRTLKLLADSGLARAHDFGDGVTRYEPLWGQEHHDHLICESCRKTIEIMDPTIERRQEELAKRYGFTLSHHKMTLYGLCPDCRKK